jgi:alanine racemase
MAVVKADAYGHGAARATGDAAGGTLACELFCRVAAPAPRRYLGGES